MPISSFYKYCCGKNGYRTTCKKCMNTTSATYRENNKNTISEYQAEYTKENKDNLIKYRQSFYKKYNKGNEFEERRKMSIEKNKNKISERGKKYREKHQEKNIEYQKKYREENRLKLNEYKLAYHKRNPHIKAWRTVLRGVLIRFNKPKQGKTLDLLGYSALELKDHISSLFTEGMSWDNYGKWHIDHKKGVKTFSPDTPLHIVNALSNLQPLWAIDNLKKH